jgi:hypothetical protein
VTRAHTPSSPDEQVERAEITHCADQAAGDELFADHDFRQAAVKYRVALDGVPAKK